MGKHVEGGWLVDAAMAESPAEEAGIVRGDRIIEISKQYAILSAPIMIYIRFSRAQHSVREASDAAHGVTTTAHFIYAAPILRCPGTISQHGRGHLPSQTV